MKKKKFRWNVTGREPQRRWRPPGVRIPKKKQKTKKNKRKTSNCSRARVIFPFWLRFMISGNVKRNGR